MTPSQPRPRKPRPGKAKAAKPRPARKPKADPAIDWSTEARMLSCDRSVAWQAIQERIQAGGLSREEAIEGIVGSWLEFFNRVGENAAEPDDALEVLEFWRRCHRIHWLCWPQGFAGMADPEFQRFINLHETFARAEGILVATAERLGLDGSSFAESGRHFFGIVAEHAGRREGLSLLALEDWPQLAGAGFEPATGGLSDRTEPPPGSFP
jgi:hypothetical protein